MKIDALRKLVIVPMMLSGVLLGGCTRARQDFTEKDALAIYQPVKEEILKKYRLCEVNSFYWDAKASHEALPSEVRSAIIFYDSIQDALASVGVTLEFVNDPNLPVSCQWSDDALRYNPGSSYFLYNLKIAILDENNNPVFLKDAEIKIDVLRVSVSSKPAEAIADINDKNSLDPSKFVIEVDPDTGIKKRVFTVYLNPGAPYPNGLSFVFSILYKNKQAT